MRRSFLIPLLLCLLLPFNGCIDFLIRYTIHPNQSAAFALYITLDRDMIELITGMQSDTTASGQKKPIHLTQHTIDSLRDDMFKSDEFKELRSKKYVSSVSSDAKATDSTLQFSFDVELTSYRYLDSVQVMANMLDSIKNASASTPTSANKMPYLTVSGDSIKFALPLTSQPDAMASLGKDTSSADSMTAMVKAMTAMLTQNMKFRFEFSAPQLLSHDTSAVYDKRRNTIVWDLTGAALTAPSGQRYAWFKKP